MSWLERRHRKPLTKDQLLGIANYLTYGRIAAVPVVLVLMSMINDLNTTRQEMNYFLSWLSMAFLTIAGISDVIDGYYARRYGVISSFGKFLDPLADKLLSMSVMIMMIPMHRINAWMVIVLIARDVTITALRSMASDEGLELSASGWGKKKMLMHMFALGFLLVHYPTWGLDPHRIGTVLIWLTMALSLGSGIHYVWCFFGEVLEKNKIEGGS
ncbi:MAG: CDP-diacylglycerol--glycerol-3-phosphate 3-phosphatidyltransferase [Deltaproteobacteria bacterium]|nr:CDP-diacylglycerol--glycerol-3-phosphate 3-phosphatidyltransferase [Deltaproteobacteria bacterium]